ncbi:MAG: PD-(D/E)XK nuclease family protein [Gammaproteobacteria bacterium]|nr:PD-(D/E)XK nuclease family protein [Gammaproteobacteria bacterium]
MSIRLFPYHEDLLATAAARTLQQAAAQLPDLSSVVILVADTLASNSLRTTLCAQAQQAGHAALLGLRITTLRDWIESSGADDQPPLNEPARHLLLVEALRQHSGLFGEDDPWRVADSLLGLFDELSLHRAQLPASEAALAERLAQGYRISGPTPAALTREAHIVHRLWQAWQEQTTALQRPDPWIHYLNKLQQQITPAADEPYFILIGLQAQSQAEHEWVAARLRTGRAEWLLHGNTSAQATLADRALIDILPLCSDCEEQASDNPRSKVLDNVYPQADLNLRQRAAQLAQQFPRSPLHDSIATLAADSAEQEARAIDIQVRRWLLEGKQRIGIVTEDRRLARRVRALLERAGIVLADSGGWALSTTSAAACVERWLQCIEEDFAHQPLLDLLKSPFLCADEERGTHLTTVYRLEHDIIQHENIARGLERYRRQIEFRRHRANWPAATFEPLHALLDRIEKAARPLLKLHSGTASARLFLAQLRVSLSTLGIWPLLDADAAGQRVLALWEELDAAAQRAPLTLSWQEFRIWLGRALEAKTFRPSLASGPVQLLTLEQSQLVSFDALVLGACDHEHLPGKDRATAFFNTGVRRELGLPTWEQKLAQRLYQFRRVLDSAPQLLLTRRREDQGEPVLASPWLEALETLHQLAWATTLEDTTIKTLMLDDRCAVVAAQPAPLPSPPLRPKPSLPVALLPETISASSHQHLIDCPYRYFASDGLSLAPREEVREQLQKSDYGERVHRCLEAFHGEVEHLPGPFTQPFNADTRANAIILLEHITTAVFARDLEDNFQHRGWLKRWWQLIPSYVDWQIQRAADWQVQQVEARVEQAFGSVAKLKGRLDRIDADGRAVAILDYKTGGIPAQADIDAGEAVQLPFYALLSGEAAVQVDYLKLDGDRVQTKGGLSGDELFELRDAVGTRLAELQTAVAEGQPLPAWGDPDTCRYCPMDGLCRRAAWEE